MKIDVAENCLDVSLNWKKFNRSKTNIARKDFMEKLSKMKIEVLRIGQRVIRDDRVTTYCTSSKGIWSIKKFT